MREARSDSDIAAPMHRVVLCADDFGVTEGVSRGIVELARIGRLSATSVMTHRPWWPRLAPALAELQGRIGIGLHLTLTLGTPLGVMARMAPDGTFLGLSEVLRRSHLGQLPADEIADEISRQLDAFEAVIGRPPNFVDGHQHVHVLPGIRAPLLQALVQRGWGGPVWLRDPSDQVLSILRRRVAIGKALSVQVLASGFGKAARAAGFAVNEGFSGFSSFDPARDAAADFASFFDALGAYPVVMCHPGHVNSELRSLDPVVETRAQEYAYLASDRFLELLDSRAIALVPRPG